MERTLILVKPDAMHRYLGGTILARLEKAGLKIVGIKLLQISKATAEMHYKVHKEKPFYKGLVEYITSGPVIAAAMEGYEAVAVSRRAMGDTDPAKAQKGTIRADFGLDIEHNSVHGSDSPETAKMEVGLFFGPGEVLTY